MVCQESQGVWGGCNICYVHSVQDSAGIVKHWGEMHPPRASVLMCLACTELSLSTSLHLKLRRCKTIAHTECILMIQIMTKVEKNITVTVITGTNNYDAAEIYK